MLGPPKTLVSPLPIAFSTILPQNDDKFPPGNTVHQMCFIANKYGGKIQRMTDDCSYYDVGRDPTCRGSRVCPSSRNFQLLRKPVSH
jgi:hypothetical protein